MARVRVSCDQCQMLSINGVACHETGCPNSGKKRADGEWVRFVECPRCGFEHSDSSGICADCAEDEAEQARLEAAMENIRDVQLEEYDESSYE